MPELSSGVVLNLLAVGDTDISARYCHYVNSTFHLEFMRTLVFLIKLPSFLKQIFHIYPFLEERYFYKKKLLVKLGNDVFDSIHFVSSELLTQHINR